MATIRKSVDLVDVSTQKARIDRALGRTPYWGVYWSANKVNWDESQMPQTLTGIYCGPLWVARVNLDMDIQSVQDELTRHQKQLAQVVEAMWFGVHCKKLVRKHGNIKVLGSVGHPPRSREYFCPTLFVFYSSARASVSLGIDPLDKENGKLFVPKGTRILVINQ